MNGIEERLRDELKEFAQRAQPGSIRPLRAPAPRRRARTARWLAPVAAATAVVTVVAGLTLAGHAVSNPSASGGSATMPRYYVVLMSVLHNSHGHEGAVETVNVYASATGRLLDKVAVPNGADFGNGGITAAADDRTFVINNDGGLYLLRLSASGHASPLKWIPFDNGPTGGRGGEKGFSPALSPDGNQLALAAEVCNGRCEFGIDVFSLAHLMAPKVWLTPGLGGLPGTMSWSSDSKQVMFNVITTTRTTTTAQYRLLNVSRPAGNLLTESRPMHLPATLSAQTALLTPDGQAVVGSTAHRDPGGKTVTGKIVEVSRSTGRVLRVLMVGTAPYVSDPWPSDGSVVYDTSKGGCSVLSMAASGVQPLVLCYHRFGRIEGGRFTPMTGYPATTSDRTGWDAVW